MKYRTFRGLPLFNRFKCRRFNLPSHSKFGDSLSAVLTMVSGNWTFQLSSTCRKDEERGGVGWFDEAGVREKAISKEACTVRGF